MKTHVKICGITNTGDAGTAAGLGADFIGVIIEINYSPRSVALETAASIIDCCAIPVILLLEKSCDAIFDLVSEVKPYGVQLIGEHPFKEIRRLKKMTACAVWKTVHLPKEGAEKTSVNDLVGTIEQYRGSGVDVFVLDTMVGKQKGGTGRTCDWGTACRLVQAAAVPFFLAGGISPANVKQAVQQVKPYGIDISSGVEKTPGQKDPEKISELMQNIMDNRP